MDNHRGASPIVWKGTLGNLLLALGDHRDGADTWPKSARGLGDALRRQRPALAQVGVNIEIGKPGRDDVSVNIARKDIPREFRERCERRLNSFPASARYTPATVGDEQKVF